MIAELKKVNKILTIKERKKLIYLTILKFFSGIMDMFGVVSIIPFLAAVSSEKFINENIYVLQIREFFNLNRDEIIIYFAIFSLLLLVLNQLMKVFSGWYETYVSQNIWSSLYNKAFKFYLDQPYKYHIKTNSNQILERLNVRVNAAVAGVVSPIFAIVGHFFTCSLLFILLLVANPSVTFIIIIFTGLFFFIIYFLLRKKIEEYGKFAPEYSEKTFKLTDQALRSIKDIKMKDNAIYYRNLVSSLMKQFVHNYIRLNFFSIFPRSLLELFTYSFAFGIAIYFVRFGENFSNTFILLGIYAFSFQKIIPAAQGIYTQISQIKFYKPSLDIIYDELLQSTKNFDEKIIIEEKYKKFLFSDKIIFNNVEFKYAGSKEKTLSIENLEIKQGNFVGITGQTGAGKTTFIDLLLGLLHSTSGKILVDSIELNEDFVNAWRSKIGYVPQFSFMADDTVTNNIALGQNKIDLKQVKKVCKIAKIDDFIENSLPLKYETIIGENGVRLSGGQRQRISLARALYKNPNLIVLDEATNSLDSITEKNVLISLLDTYKNVTIIMIAHRLSVLEKCDKIFLLEKGKLLDSGTHDSLLRKNLTFKEMNESTINKEKL